MAVVMANNSKCVVGRVAQHAQGYSGKSCGRLPGDCRQQRERVHVITRRLSL